MTDIIKDSTATEPQEYFEVTERIFVDADGNVVDEFSPEAAFLYATPGKRVPLEEAVDKGIAKKKQAKQAQNKQAKAAENK